MKNHRGVLSALLFLFALGFATVAAAQDAPDRSEGKAKVEGRAGDTNFDFRIQGGESKQDQAQPGRPSPEGDRALPGPQGPAGQPGPQGPTGPSGGAVLGMDPTIALLVGLGVLAVVIVAIVAASRSRE